MKKFLKFYRMEEYVTWANSIYSRPHRVLICFPAVTFYVILSPKPKPEPET